MFAMVMSMAIGVAQTIGIPATPDKQTLLESVMSFLIDNWVWLLPAITWLIHRIWPTEKADRIITIIKWIFDKLIPDRKKLGGNH